MTKYRLKSQTAVIEAKDSWELVSGLRNIYGIEARNIWEFMVEFSGRFQDQRHKAIRTDNPRDFVAGLIEAGELEVVG